MKLMSVKNTGVVGEADGRTILNMIEAIEPKVHTI
jgi:hypothetical protein